MKAFIIEILRNKDLTWWIMALGIFILSQLIKLPIKHFTNKLSEVARKRANSVILAIPLGLGILAVYIYGMWVMPKLGQPATFNIVDGIILGSQSIAFYGVFERFLGKKIYNPYETEQGKEYLAMANQAVADGKLSKDEAKKLFADNVLTKQEQEQIKNLINPKGN